VLIRRSDTIDSDIPLIIHRIVFSGQDTRLKKEMTGKMLAASLGQPFFQKGANVAASSMLTNAQVNTQTTSASLTIRSAESSLDRSARNFPKMLEGGRLHIAHARAGWAARPSSRSLRLIEHLQQPSSLEMRLLLFA